MGPLPIWAFFVPRRDWPRALRVAGAGAGAGAAERRTQVWGVRRRLPGCVVASETVDGVPYLRVVADTWVYVPWRKIGRERQWQWQCDGGGAFQVSPHALATLTFFCFTMS